MLSTFNKLQFVIKSFVSSIFEFQIYTGFMPILFSDTNFYPVIELVKPCIMTKSLYAFNRVKLKKKIN